MDRSCLCLKTLLILLVWSWSSAAQFLLDVEDETGHFDIDSQFEGVFSCYFCVNVTSNEMCNRWAIEMPCPTDQTACLTRHTMDSRGGRTLTVTKNCTTQKTCSSQVGCRQDKSANQTICVSCCESAFCNEDVAYNSSTAVFQRSGDRSAAFSSASSNTSFRRRSFFYATYYWMILMLPAVLPYILSC